MTQSRKEWIDMKNDTLPTVAMCTREDIHAVHMNTQNSKHYLSEQTLSLFDVMLDDLQKIALGHVSGLTLNPNLDTIDNKREVVRTFMKRFDENLDSLLKPYYMDKAEKLDLDLFLGCFVTSYCAILEALISAQTELGNVDIPFKDNHEFNVEIGATLQRHLDAERARLTAKKDADNVQFGDSFGDEFTFGDDSFGEEFTFDPNDEFEAFKEVEVPQIPQKKSASKKQK